MIRTEHREVKWNFPFVSYEPEDFEGKLPLIVQLHGVGERGHGKDDLFAVDTHGFSKLLQNNGYPCLFVMPQCPPDTFWACRVESIHAFIQQLKQEYNIDEDRVYLTGLSMGGYGTWFTAQAMPEVFAAIAPVCGGGMSWGASVLKMPIWTFHGTEDQTVKPYHTEEMVASLKACGADVTYTVLDGVAHNAWDYAYNDALVRWLLSKTRKK